MNVTEVYRLQPLLNAKTNAKEKAERALARALLRLKEARERLDELVEEKQKIARRQKEVRYELHEKVRTGKARVKDGSHRVQYLKRLEDEEKAKDREIEDQKKVIETCETEVKRARRDYINAVKELRVMEKHKLLWAKKLKLFLSRKEEVEMDELGNIIHQLRRVA